MMIDTTIESLLPALLAEGLTPEEIVGVLLPEGYELEAIVAALRAAAVRQGPVAAPDALLAPAEQARYAEQMRALAALRRPDLDAAYAQDGQGQRIQLALKQAMVLLVDCGSIGERLLHSLAQIGVGRLVTVAGSAQPADAALRQRRTAELQAINPYVEYLDIDSAEELPGALHDRQADLVVYCPDCFSSPAAARINRACLEQQTPLLFYRQRRFSADVGPLVIAGETACYECFERRRQAVLSDHERLLSEREGVAPLPGLSLGVEWLVFEVVKQLTGVAEPVSRGRIVRFSALSGMSELHSVLKLPRCPACGVHRAQPLRKLWEE